MRQARRSWVFVLAGLLLPIAAQAQTQDYGVGPGWGATVTGSVPSAKVKGPDKSKGSDKSSEKAPSPPPRAVQAPAANGNGRVATSAALTGDGGRTVFSLDLSGPVRFTAFRLTNPFRIVVDMEDLAFRLPPGAGHHGRGLITAFRYGLFAPGKARIVIDTTGPVRIERSELVASASGTARLEISLLPTTASELAAAELAAAAQSIDLKQPEATSLQPPPAQAPRSRERPVIVIDPGHGGIDPGAQGASGYEKDVVLAVAMEIRNGLMASRRYEVVMTRSSDVFVSLDQRVKLSRKHQADLFLSIHADSLAQRELAQNIRGATIYTLSDKATDDRARALAEKENASDVLAGLQAGREVGDDQVRNILVDLMRRETSNLATEFRRGLVGQLRAKVALAKEPMRSAPFKVLRQPGSPAVLIELGYMSNAEDEKQMGTEAWRRGVGEAVAKAVDAYFRKRSAEAQ